MSSNGSRRPHDALSRWSALYAWGAGAAFVASLGYFAYFYAVGLERRPPASNGPASRLKSVAFDVLLFAGFAAHHSILARTWAKQWLTRVIPADLERATYVWTASALFMLTCREWRTLPGECYRIAGTWSWVARAAQGAGLALVATSSGALDVLDLAGIRQAQEGKSANRAPDAGRARPPQLVTSGPYGLVRHPLYLGWILLIFGTRRMTWNRLLFATLSSGYLILAIEWEEQSLVETFGQAYHAYAADVPWKIVPFVH